ncbi:MAG: hypothetical protein RL117_518 [Verrucomicrobiota bacterium]
MDLAGFDERHRSIAGIFRAVARLTIDARLSIASVDRTFLPWMRWSSCDPIAIAR